MHFVPRRAEAVRRTAWTSVLDQTILGHEVYNHARSDQALQDNFTLSQLWQYTQVRGFETGWQCAHRIWHAEAEFGGKDLLLATGNSGPPVSPGRVNRFPIGHQAVVVSVLISCVRASNGLIGLGAGDLRLVYPRGATISGGHVVYVRLDTSRIIARVVKDDMHRAIIRV